MKAVLLDFNGTLFFDSSFHEEAWVKIFRELHENAEEEPDISHICGPRNDIIIQNMAPWLSKEERDKVSQHKESLYRQICKDNPNSLHLVPGVIDFLEKLKEEKIPFILASASIKDNIDFYFETFGLEKWFDKDICVYDDGSYADKGDMHKEAARRLCVDIKECVIIEDSISGITHAKEVGAGKIIAVGNDKTKDEILNLGVDMLIYDFTEIKFDMIIE